ncbi:hypothetical protein AOQ84DRAFT_226106 [Glonium stellatum]|uniref:Uncharacterized protein n=1 Tax=Glonium stellatum TaxID=574774 RepID=A0A8E2F9S6_9PEZI|nr:hypothetical protein AOQ84DRAFT_226106 [Glonium stellatum]
MPSGQGTGTNPIHNKKPKKQHKEEDDEDKAFKAKQQAGPYFFTITQPFLSPLHLESPSFHIQPDVHIITHTALPYTLIHAKARAEMAAKAKGKGPLNAGQQGIKKSGKK